MAIFEGITAGFEVLQSRFNTKPEVVVNQHLIGIGEIGEQNPNFSSRGLSVSPFWVNHEIVPTKAAFLSHRNWQILFWEPRSLRQVVEP
jgi:hypothetical protein